VFPLWADPPSEGFCLRSVGFAFHKQFQMKWDGRAKPLTSYNNVIIMIVVIVMVLGWIRLCVNPQRK